MNKRAMYILSGLVLASTVLSGFNAVKVMEVEKRVAEIKPVQQAQESASFSFPTGTPQVYGEELDVKYEDVSSENPEKAEKTIQKFASYDSIEISGAKKDRYTDILYRMDGGISCEYCCEAESVITVEGKPGCGCSHAVAMRGLTKYLLKNHGNEMSDREIFQEVAKWKTRYFPKQTRAKVKGLREQGAEVSLANLASNRYRGVSSHEGGWVGDC
ncbi:MAG: hypothetical protein ABEJ91_02120 [Candidatus Nanohaloarchaea archaeon]